MPYAAVGRSRIAIKSRFLLTRRWKERKLRAEIAEHFRHCNPSRDPAHILTVFVRIADVCVTLYL